MGISPYQRWIETISKLTVKAISKEKIIGSALFGFMFPKTSLLKEDFEKGKEAAIAYAYFFDNNEAKIIRDGAIIECTWLSAYDKIARTSLRRGVIPKPLDITTVAPSEGVTDRLNGWVLLLNAMPFVHAELCGKKVEGYENEDKDLPNPLIAFSFPLSISSIFNNQKELKGFLLEDGTVSWGHSQEIYKNGPFAEFSESWKSAVKLVSNHIKGFNNMIPTIHDMSIQETIETIVPPITTEELKQRMSTFKESIETSFAHIPCISVGSGDNENLLLDIGFPLTIGKILGDKSEGTLPWVLFFGNGTACFCHDEAGNERCDEKCYDSEPCKRYLNDVWGKYISWREAAERLRNFIKGLTELAKQQTEPVEKIA